MTRYAQLYATQYARDQSAKSIVRRPNARSARFTAISLSATFAALRIYVKRRTAPSARPSARQLTAALNARLLTLCVLLCARPLSVTGSARSQLPALSPSASSSASAQLVIPALVRMVPRQVAALAPTRLTWLPPSVLLTPSWRSHLRLPR